MKIAETFPPGEFLRDELEARGWSQTQLAEIMGRPFRLINEIIAGKKAITPETAIQLGDSLGTGPELWMNLESQYQLSRVSASDGQVARRAKLYERFPVREMIKRGWLQKTKVVSELEQACLAFFGLESLDEPLNFCHAAKKTEVLENASDLQLAWLYRARQLASEQIVAPYTPERLRQTLTKLASLLPAPEEARHAPRLLAECGVRFVVVEPIPGSKIDGACFWLSDTQPVVAMSLRLDRIDNFWFVLRHELEHVLCEHGKGRGYLIDQDLDPTEQVNDEEDAANCEALDFCVSQSELTGFIARVGPFFAEERVVLFAQRIKVHPGLVVGQLQRRLRRYDFLRAHQVKVRQFVVASARTDGWGVIDTA
jgi:HTH-type transcriptional regulator / antitoxin HigA